MKWEFDNGTHLLGFTIDELNEMKRGAIYTVKTRKQDLIVIKRIRG